jgi:hypothetical protein
MNMFLIYVFLKNPHSGCHGTTDVLRVLRMVLAVARLSQVS